MVLLGTDGGWLIGSDIALETREGNRIPNARVLQREPGKMREVAAQWKNRLPNIECRSLASTYNCMGLLFAARRVDVLPYEGTGTLNDVLRRIIWDDGLREVTEAEAAEGDMVVYRETPRGEVTHVGIILARLAGEEPFQIVSQWGSHGEYKHRLNDVPEAYGAIHDFYTDRLI